MPWRKVHFTKRHMHCETLEIMGKTGHAQQPLECLCDRLHTLTITIQTFRTYHCVVTMQSCTLVCIHARHSGSRSLTNVEQGCNTQACVHAASPVAVQSQVTSLPPVSLAAQRSKPFTSAGDLFTTWTHLLRLPSLLACLNLPRRL